MGEISPGSTARQAAYAVLLWLAFFLVNMVINATIPFALGADVHAWTVSGTKTILVGFIVYGGFFLVAPLLMVKGWATAWQPGSLVPLALAVLAAGMAMTFRGTGVVILLALVALHRRYDLSDLGIRSSGWRGDVLAVILIAALYTTPRLFRPFMGEVDLVGRLQAGLLRLLGNPATSSEYLFYFGFLATRIARRAGPIITPMLIGLMYMAHEITNPEYWYEGMQFLLVFVGVSLAAAILLWRRSLVPIWLGDGLARSIQALLR